jgi:hypothetical protein
MIVTASGEPHFRNMDVAQSPIQITSHVLNRREIRVREREGREDFLNQIFGARTIVSQVQSPTHEPIVVLNEGRFLRF